MYRDSLGRFASKPNTPTIPSTTYHNVRDEKGRFTSKQPVYKTDAHGNLRDKLGRFVANPAKVRRQLTVGDIIDAIEKNGYPQGFGHYVQKNEYTGAVESACALGQGMLNLGIGQRRITNALGGDIASRIISLNDSHHLPLKEIAKRIREQYAHRLNLQTNVYSRKAI
jgi:hypothetical protein